MALFAPSFALAEDTTITDTSRLVTIGGSITEIVYALGKQDSLVARDSTSIYPDDALELPDVGYMRQLSPEGVLSMNPTGIIALEGSGPPEALEVLRKARVPLRLVPETYDRNGIVKKIEAVGAALGIPEEAAALARTVDADIKAAESATADISERVRVLFILSLQGGRVLASGSGTAADGIIRMAGAVNAVEGFQGYKQLTEEALIEAQPDVILMMNRSENLNIAKDELLSHPAIAATPAGQERRFVTMDGAYLLGFGPRTPSAIRDLSTAFYGRKAAR
ncbi:hemin ABC transporter substrate-binding protein [Chelativorans sp. Marseille-P2723]|uniref:heme/hemin ABC transporter substrate-binding protein n=1 Tax=Chelativorans sp. Marseille-P2723 TaxID=2709133 RepID=UPI001FF04D30|nr:hemin ABC transporter substrate-binding protein [Chelativorans sp. Marseille-P2723]